MDPHCWAYWLHAITLDWKQLNRVHQVRHKALQDVLDQYADLFKPEMRTLQGTTVKIHVKPDARPRLFEPDQCRTHFQTKSRPTSKNYAKPMWSSPCKSLIGQHLSFPYSSLMAPSEFVVTTNRQSTRRLILTSIRCQKWTIS